MSEPNNGVVVFDKYVYTHTDRRRDMIAASGAGALLAVIAATGFYLNGPFYKERSHHPEVAPAIGAVAVGQDPNVITVGNTRATINPDSIQQP